LKGCLTSTASVIGAALADQEFDGLTIAHP
jgi:hypothetical protein